MKCLTAKEAVAYLLKDQTLAARKKCDGHLKVCEKCRSKMVAMTVGLETGLAMPEAPDNGCSICNDPKCDNPGGKH